MLAQDHHRSLCGHPHIGRAGRQQTGESARWLLVVDVASMRKSDHDDKQYVVLDGVDDPVIAHAHTQPRATLKHSAPGGRGSWASNAIASSTRRRIWGSSLRRARTAAGAKLDAVGAHSQPRSTLTCAQGMFGPASAIASSKGATSSASSKAVISCS